MNKLSGILIGSIGTMLIIVFAIFTLFSSNEETDEFSFEEFSIGMSVISTNVDGEKRNVFFSLTGETEQLFSVLTGFNLETSEGTKNFTPNSDNIYEILITDPNVNSIKFFEAIFEKDDELLTLDLDKEVSAPPVETSVEDNEEENGDNDDEEQDNGTNGDEDNGNEENPENGDSDNDNNEGEENGEYDDEGEEELTTEMISAMLDELPSFGETYYYQYTNSSNEDIRSFREGMLIDGGVEFHDHHKTFYNDELLTFLGVYYLGEEEEFNDIYFESYNRGLIEDLLEEENQEYDPEDFQDSYDVLNLGNYYFEEEEEVIMLYNNYLSPRIFDPVSSINTIVGEIDSLEMEGENLDSRLYISNESDRLFIELLDEESYLEVILDDNGEISELNVSNQNGEEFKFEFDIVRSDLRNNVFNVESGDIE